MIRACRYEPELNRTYAEMAAHYGTVIIPARPRRPRDRAKGESAVQVVERVVLAPLRDRTFFSLAEVNQALAEGRERLNDLSFQKLPGSRRTLFETLDRPALRPLPAERYELAQWRTVRVNIDYHLWLMSSRNGCAISRAVAMCRVIRRWARHPGRGDGWRIEAKCQFAQ